MSGRFFDGYAEARAAVQAQDLDADLALIDMLFGRDALAYGATPEDVKGEALDQLAREWTDPAWERERGAFVRAARELVRDGRSYGGRRC